MQANATQISGFGINLSGTLQGQGFAADHGILKQAPLNNFVGNTTQVDHVMGRLEIKAIGLTVPILDSFDPSSLRKGVGHIHGTALPGGLGNMALAGHRDTFFRPLRNMKQGMTISVFTVSGHFEYVVDSTSIVDPEQVSVLAIHDIPELTLITCYPFEFIGSAPHRFIVRAHLKSVESIQD